MGAVSVVLLVGSIGSIVSGVILYVLTYYQLLSQYPAFTIDFAWFVIFAIALLAIIFAGSFMIHKKVGDTEEDFRVYIASIVLGALGLILAVPNMSVVKLVAHKIFWTKQQSSDRVSANEQTPSSSGVTSVRV